MPVAVPAVVALFGTARAVVVPAVQPVLQAAVGLQAVARIDIRVVQILAVLLDRDLVGVDRHIHIVLAVHNLVEVAAPAVVVAVAHIAVAVADHSLVAVAAHIVVEPAAHTVAVVAHIVAEADLAVEPRASRLFDLADGLCVFWQEAEI